MEDITFRVVEVDGTLADIRTVFINLATAVLDRPVEVPDDLEPPHTISRLSVAAGLAAEEQSAVRATIHEIRDFWAGLPAALYLANYGAWHALHSAGLSDDDLVVFHARRLQTRGRPALLQTIEWLIRQGYENPIVWCEED